MLEFIQQIKGRIAENRAARDKKKREDAFIHQQIELLMSETGWTYIHAQAVYMNRNGHWDF